MVVLKMITTVKPTTDGSAAMFPSLLVKFVAFVEIAEKKFTISNWKLNATQLSLGRQFFNQSLIPA